MTRTGQYLLSCLPVLLLAACWVIPPQQGPDRSLVEEGEVLLYLQPFSQEAERITFTLTGVSAERDDGTLIPLLLRMPEIAGIDMKRQRLVASGRLTPGSYRGFSFELKNGLLRTEEGEAALLVPDQPVKKHSPFWIDKDKSMVLSLTFNYRDSIQNGYRFSPVFQIVQPERPLVGLTGYVTNQGSGTITVFDKRRMRVTGAIAVGDRPKGMVVDPLLKRAYAALPDDDAVVIVDIGSGEVINRIVLLRGDKPQDLVLSPDGKTLLTVNGGSNTVSFLDPESAVEITKVSVGDGPQAIVADRSGARAYVFNTFSNSISVIDVPKCINDISRGRECALLATVNTDYGPLFGEFNKKGDRLYVMYSGSPYLNVLDPVSFFVKSRVLVGMQPAALKVDTNTDMVYVARKGASEVDVYDPFSLLPVEVIRTQNSTDFMTIDNESNTLLLLSSEAETVTALELNSKSIVSAVQVGKDPYRVRVMGER